MGSCRERRNWARRCRNDQPGGVEIVSCETAIGVARALGMHDVAALLVQTRSEEVAMDAMLQRLLAAGLGISVV